MMQLWYLLRKPDSKILYFIIVIASHVSFTGVGEAFLIFGFYTHTKPIVNRQTDRKISCILFVYSTSNPWANWPLPIVNGHKSQMITICYSRGCYVILFILYLLILCLLSLMLFHHFLNLLLSFSPLHIKSAFQSCFFLLTYTGIIFLF